MRADYVRPSAGCQRWTAANRHDTHRLVDLRCAAGSTTRPRRGRALWATSAERTWQQRARVACSIQQRQEMVGKNHGDDERRSKHQQLYRAGTQFDRGTNMLGRIRRQRTTQRPHRT